MDSDQRLQIMSALASVSGGQLRLFFVSVGLGDAFDAPGPGWGKAQKVASAIAAAERHERGDDVLLRAAKHFSIPVRLDAASPDTRTDTRRASGRARSDERQKLAVFISVSERQKEALARPFGALLAPNVEGFVVSDLPLIDGAYSPDEKVDAYLARADAVVVFATADIAAEDNIFIRLNIADEIARARSKEHLRGRICVLKEPGVKLPSNTNPAYARLDPGRPQAAFVSALEQLRAWGFEVVVPEASDIPDVPAASAARADKPNVASPLPNELEREALERALARVPDVSHTSAEPSTALVIVAAPRRSLLRPSELEDPTLARWLEQEAVYGDIPILNRDEITNAEMRGNSLVIHQQRGWLALDAEGTLVVLRPLQRDAGGRFVLGGVIEEDVVADLQGDLAFADRVLARIDPAGGATHVVPVAALIAAGHSGWRTRAEQAANPTTMTMDINGGNQIVGRLSPPARPRPALHDDASGLASDLMLLLRRQARRR
jgi:hypothetical protein